MSRLFGKKSPEREALRSEFERVADILHRTDEVTQAAVGYSINMATRTFVNRFSSIEAFTNLPKNQRMDYIRSLTLVEKEFIQKDSHTALGFGLFKMWIAAITENDTELMKQFGEELSFFSRKGDLPV